MPFHDVHLPGPITLVPGNSLEGSVRRQARDHPALPTDPRQIVADLSTRPDGVPVTLSEPRGQIRDWSLLVYGRTYVARLFPTARRGGYVIGGLNPLRIRDHHRLADGYLRVRAAGWRVVYDVRQIPPGATAHWDRLAAEWRRLSERRAAEQGAPPVTTPQTVFLDRLDRIIDATERIRREDARSTSPYPYRSVGSTSERRHGKRAVYIFELAGGRQPDEGAFVQIHGEPEQRGQVTRVAGDSVTVRFDDPVDWGRIPRTGELAETPSTVVHDKQREAVALLRGRQARNPGLLPVFVEHRPRPIPRSSAAPAESLDDSQLMAYRRALTVPDMLLVLGPPGTGKTHTISQIVRTCALDQGERILLTSHSNRAVDNVLSKLPRELEAIRVGHEGRVTEEGLPYLLERRATELRQRILSQTRRSLAAYGDLEVATQWAEHLGERVGGLEAAIADSDRAAEEHARARRAAGGPLAADVDRLGAKLARLSRRLDHNQRLARLLGRCRAWAQPRTGLPPAGLLLTLLVRVLARSTEALSERADRLRDSRKRQIDELHEAERRLDAATRDDPAVRAARGRMDDAAGRRADRRKEALTAAHALRAMVSATGDPPAVRDEVEGDLTRLRDWADRRLPVIVARKNLLADWQREVSGATDQLHTELVRYAHVIAATATGAATRQELSGIAFDLAIVDEAGQIGIADALVPLVRARRAVLVGDDQQLPPFLDSEAQSWGKNVEDPAVRTLLAKSALEILNEELPDTHVVPLTWQRRMPKVIADFVSTRFYEGRLRTDVRREHRDPLFGSPLAFVDTSKLPAARRHERSGKDRESWGQKGFTNPAEADLLIELAVFYHRQGADWAVIVPYRAQLARIRAAVAARIGDARLAGLNVGTVDAFQGGERDVILYGFTRSNTRGQIGFLRELRRTNVAITRVKRQLVLVGDLDTLARADDHDFRELALSLRGHVAEHGEIRAYEEIAARLDGGGEA